MFPLRKYQPVSQHTDSDSDEDIILYAQSKTTRESEFGGRKYDEEIELSLPTIKTLQPSRHHRHLRHSRVQSMFAVCLLVVFLCVLLSVAVATIVFGQQWSSSEDTSKESSSFVHAPPPTPLPIPPSSSATGLEHPSTPSTSDTRPPSPPPTIPPSSPPPTKPPSSAPPTKPPSSPPPTIPPSSPPPTIPPSSPPPTKPPSSPPPTIPPSSPPPTIPPSSPPPTIPPSSPPTSETQSPTEPLVATESTSEPPIDTQVPSTSETESLTQSTSVIIVPTAVPPSSSSSPLSSSSSPSPSVQNGTHTITSSLSPSTSSSFPLSSPLFTPPSSHSSTHPSSSPPSSSPPSPASSLSSPNMTISWEREFFPAATESTLQLYDMNQDGTLDVLAVNGYSQCAVKILAFDGINGSTVWEADVGFEAFAVKCELDVDSDGVKDCLATGRYSGFVALSGLNGTILWVADRNISFPRYNFYFPLIVHDLDGDGVDDLINIHGGDSTYKDSEKHRSPSFLVVISGRTGQALTDRFLVPDGHESYMSPVLFSFADGTEVILFGTGGETLPGSLWAVTLSSIQAKVQEYTATSPEYANYKVLQNYTNHPCVADISYDEIEAQRPKFDTSAYDIDETDLEYPPFSSCPHWGELRPIWNKYNMCMYELVRTKEKGMILPPVIVDVTGDGSDDLVVSTFDGRTLLLDGRNGSTVWEIFLPDTEAYSLPAPLFFNEDSTPDLLVRVNKGEWDKYDYSYMAVLDGRDGGELWTLNSSRTGMMSGLSIASDTHGLDAAVFLSIGTPPGDGSEHPWVFNGTVSDSHSSNEMEQGPDRSKTVSGGLGVGPKDPPDAQGSKELTSQEKEERADRDEGGNAPAGRPRVARYSSDRCTRVYFEGPGSKVCRWYEWLVDGEGRPFVRVKRHEDDDGDGGGEAMEDGDEGEESGGGRDVVDYSSDFIQQSLKIYDPPRLWDSTPTDPFPDPTTQLDAFLHYCNHSQEHLTAFLYLVTPEMVKGGDVRPLITHGPFVYIPAQSSDDEPPPQPHEAPPTDAPPTRNKRHGMNKPHKNWETNDYKRIRCNRIEGPSMIPATPTIGDLDGDGRLEVAYVMLWGSLGGENFAMPPKLLIKTFTLEDRFVEVYGKGVVDFARFLPSRQQPWTRYMGARGDNVFQEANSPRSHVM